MYDICSKDPNYLRRGGEQYLEGVKGNLGPGIIVLFLHLSADYTNVFSLRKYAELHTNDLYTFLYVYYT